jgi:hypothetical protein
MRIPTEQLVVAARQIRALPKLGNPFPQSFSVDDALRRWEEQSDGDVDEASYMEGWRDAVKEIWEAVKPVLSRGKSGGGAADRSAAESLKYATTAVTQPVGDSPAYRALEEHLRSNEGDEVTLTFTQIEALLGRPLPESARRHRPWWSNDLTHSHARAWMGSGWRVASVDMDDQIVTFARL